MGKMRILKIVEGAFEGDDHKEVKGMYIYLVPTDEGGAPERIFLTDDRYASLSFVPKFNDVVYIFRNGYGRVIDILKA